MARPRTHDVEQALDRAVALFSARGFEAVGLTELTQAMGVPRSTLYADYGSKQGVWAEALARYRAAVAAGLEQMLGDAALGPTDRIDALLAASAASMRDGSSRSCLLVDAACEREGDATATALASANVEDVRRRVSELLHLASSTGELRPDVDVEGLAALVSTVIQGSRVLGHLPDHHSTAAAAIEQVRTVLTSSRI